jgi:hypothetical protein
MPEPKKHFENRGWIESAMRYVPGFKGYLEKEYRREADELLRNWLSERLRRGKRGLDAGSLALTEAGKIDELPQLERLRARLDKLAARMASAMQGYSGFFDLVQIDEGVLDRLYEYDLALMEQVSQLADHVEALKSVAVGAAAQRVAPLLEDIEKLEDAWDKREDLLRGLE